MLKCYKKVSELPNKWQKINQNNYQTTGVLAILERANPCDCHYVIINDRSAFIIYKLKLNLLTYAKLKFALNIHVVGIPCSVSVAGFNILPEDMDEFIEYLKSQGQFSLILNADSGKLHHALLSGHTLPTCIFDVKWDSFDAYLNSMRSHYRYRYKKAMAKGARLSIKKLTKNEQFDSELYQLYEQVYQVSEYKLEKLSIEFFREMPCEIYVFYTGDKAIGFVQLLQVKSRLNFVFGGLDYESLREYDTYQNMLLFIIKQAITRGIKQIDFGQTAEDSKLKLGCYYQYKYMHVYIKNPLLRAIVKAFKSLLSHHPLEDKFNPFKENTNEKE